MRITRAIIINLDHIWQPLFKWNLFILSYSCSKYQHKSDSEAFIQLKNAASEWIASQSLITKTNHGLIVLGRAKPI